MGHREGDRGASAKFGLRRTALALMAGVVTLCAGLVLTSTVRAEPVNGDAERGEAEFRNCIQCHKTGPGTGHGIGPNLHDVVGRRAGALDDFRYSRALVAAGGLGLEWTVETLDAFIANPREKVPGNRMSFRGVDDPQKRADLVAFLSTLTGETQARAVGRPQAEDGPATEIGAAAMAIDGDVAYGEFLASECLTCHQATGEMDGIPGIVGWDRRVFIRALFEYKTNVRTHQVMQLVTTNLGDEEIAALAAYFEELGAQ
jgi:cytochrome c